MVKKIENISRRDVFICFSKSNSMESRIAIALKDRLEQLGLFAVEYEDWDWVTGIEKKINIKDLEFLIKESKAVVFIAPKNGNLEKGKEIELEILKKYQLPIILICWNNQWDPLYADIWDKDLLDGLNIIYTLRGENTLEENIPMLLSQICWLNTIIEILRNEHSNFAESFFNLIPKRTNSDEPLLDFQVNGFLNPNHYQEKLDCLAKLLVEHFSFKEAKEIVHFWKSGYDLIAKNLIADSGFLKEELERLHSAMEAFVNYSETTFSELKKLPIKIVIRRAFTLTRLNMDIEAIELLQLSLSNAPKELYWEIYQALGTIYYESNYELAISSYRKAIEATDDKEIVCILRNNMGSLRVTLEMDLTLAIMDFTYVIENSKDKKLVNSAILGRAKIYSTRSELGQAIKEFNLLLTNPKDSPRLTVSALMNRGACYECRGKSDNAIKDWNRAINLADASSYQKFRILEARGKLYERLNNLPKAVLDFETMIRFHQISKEYREELKSKISKYHKQL